MSVTQDFEKVDWSFAIVSDRLEKHGVQFEPDEIFGHQLEALEHGDKVEQAERDLALCRLAYNHDGGRFCHILNDFFSHAKVCFLKPFGWTPNEVFSIATFKQSQRPHPIDFVVIQLWSKNAQVRFYEGSHRVELNPPPSDGSNRYLTVAKEALKGYPATEVCLPRGGVSLVDARLCFEVVAGWGFFIGIASPERASKWKAIEIWDTEHAREELKNIRADRFQIDVQLMSLPRERPSE